MIFFLPLALSPQLFHQSTTRDAAASKCGTHGQHTWVGAGSGDMWEHMSLKEWVDVVVPRLAPGRHAQTIHPSNITIFIAKPKVVISGGSRKMCIWWRMTNHKWCCHGATQKICLSGQFDNCFVSVSALLLSLISNRSHDMLFTSGLRLLCATLPVQLPVACFACNW